MNPNRQLQASFWIMLTTQTITAIDMPGKGPRKLPAPRAYIAAIALWSIFGLIADAGSDRAAATMAWVTLLAGVTLGTMGKTLTDFMNTIANQFGVPKATATTGAPGDTQTPTPPGAPPTRPRFA